MKTNRRAHLVAVGVIGVLGALGLIAAAGCGPGDGQFCNGGAGFCLPRACGETPECINNECVFSKKAGTGCPCVEGDARLCDTSGPPLDLEGGYQDCEKQPGNPNRTQWSVCHPLCWLDAPSLRSRCNGNVAQTCDQNLGWKNVTTCVSPQVCSNGACI